MAKRRHIMTPARKAALHKAQIASARKRHLSATGKRRIYGQTKNRPTGVAGLRRTATPYARVNQRSQTVGFNAGTIIPFTGKRIAFGSYLRLESTTKPKNNVPKFLKNTVQVTHPAVRVNAGRTQVRLGTSRGSGPTLIIRRGRHQTPQISSQAGVSRYQKRVAGLNKKKARPARRKKR